MEPKSRGENDELLFCQKLRILASLDNSGDNHHLLSPSRRPRLSVPSG